MAQAQLTASRGKAGWGQALRWGAIGGGIVVALDAVNAALYLLLAPKSFSFDPSLLVSSALLFVVGVLVGRGTERVGPGPVAGLVAAAVSSLVEMAILIVLIMAAIALRHSQQPASGPVSGEEGWARLGLSVFGIFVLFFALAAVLVFRLIAGAGLGALGALLGRAIRPGAREGLAYAAGSGAPLLESDPRSPAGEPSEYPRPYPYPSLPPSGVPSPGTVAPWPAPWPAQPPTAWPERPPPRARAASWWTGQLAVRIGVITAFALAGVDVALVLVSPRLLVLGEQIAPGGAWPGGLWLFLLISAAPLLVGGISAGYESASVGAGAQAGVLAGMLAAALAAPLDAVFALILLFVGGWTRSPLVLQVLGWSDPTEIMLTAFLLLGFVLPLLMIRAVIGLVGSPLGGVVGALVRRAWDGDSPTGPDDGGMGDAPSGGDGALPPNYAPGSPAGSAFPPVDAVPNRAAAP